MPTLNQNVLINGKIVRKGKSVSSASVKKLGLGDHLFDEAESKPESSEGVDESPDSADAKD